MNRLLALEPVRTWLYGLLGPAVAVLAGYGVLDDRAGALWLALGGAVLGVTGTELARAGVYAPATVERIRRNPGLGADRGNGDGGV